MTIDKVFVDMGKCLLVVATSITGLAETLGTYYLQSEGVENWVLEARGIGGIGDRTCQSKLRLCVQR